MVLLTNALKSHIVYLLGGFYILKERGTKMKKNKDIVIIGFTVFATIFGAGNLIFPPYLGMDLGSKWPISFLGFLLSDVGIILLTIIAVAKVGTYQDVVGTAGKKFGVSLEVIMMLCLGPILVIPRTAATTFEMSIQPLFNFVNPIVFSLLFFSLTLLLTIRTTKVMNLIGKFLTPILLLCLGFLIFKGIQSPIGEAKINVDSSNLFVKGITQGYQTMGALGMGGVAAFIMSSFLSKGYGKKETVNLTIKASVIAGIGLILVYSGLTYLGSTASNMYDSSISQTALLVNITNHLLGDTGKIILAIIVAIACLTTSIGLTSVTSKYFESVSNKKLKYEYVVIFICVFSAIISNFGVGKIIEISIPFLTVIYPVSIVLVVMSLFRKVITRKPIYKGVAYATLVTSLLTVVDSLGVKISFVHELPFANNGFNWLVPAVLGGIIGFAISKKNESHKA